MQRFFSPSISFAYCLAAMLLAVFIVATPSVAAARGDIEQSVDPVLDARPLLRSDLPDPLKSWVPWVLKDQPALNCPFAYNQAEDRRCVWPDKVSLVLSGKTGGTFRYQVQVFAQALVGLPGSSSHWPQGVQLNGKPLEVTGPSPRVLLPVGSHTITGSFVWAQAPESLRLPQAVGLVELSMNGRAVAQPNLNDDGQLWLAQEADGSERAAASQLTVRINRLIEDTIPVRITTQLELIASGKNQEVVLPNAVLAGFLPQELTSLLPARVEADGRLRVQVRAGRWDIRLVARNLAPLMSLPSPYAAAADAKASAVAAVAAVGGAEAKAANLVLPTEEVWAFSAQNALRLVTPEGLTSVDPAQTTLPSEWRRFPAFVVRGNDTLKLTETKRGDPQPAPDRLALRRNIWLDFDGRGYTVQDEISGAMNNSWRMEMAAPSVLGRAAVAGADQFITALVDPKKPATDAKPAVVGIEVRRGQAAVVADSRIETNARTISAVGWQKDFNAVAATLHLPPGWRLVVAAGVDTARTTWMAKWTLLDLFLLLMLALSFGRLFGVKWGVISLVGITLAYHEADVPIVPWLVVLAAIALYRALPKSGKLAKFAQASRVVSLLVLVLTLLPFMVSQIRQAMYPVLEKQMQAVYLEDDNARNRMRESEAEQQYMQNKVSEPTASTAAAPAVLEQSVVLETKLIAEPASPSSADVSKIDRSDVMASNIRRSTSKDKWVSGDAKSNAQYRLDNYDSKAMIQTGPGLPGWAWNSHALTWNGPVEQAQQISIWLVSPVWNAVLRIICVILLAAMLVCVLEIIKRWPLGLTPKSGESFDIAGLSRWIKPKVSTPTNTANTATVAMAAAIISSAFLLASAPRLHAQLPDSEMLEQLKARLTALPSCLPNCASIPRMSVSAAGDTIALRLEIHALEDVAVPLPGGIKDWLVEQVLLNGKPANALSRDSAGTLWVQLPRGVHQVQLIGKSSALDVIAFALPLKPNRVESQLRGWTLDGVNDAGQADNSLTLSRVAAAKKERESSSGEAKSGVITPFFRVERSLSLGLQWQVTTRVMRLTPANAPASLEVALLDGESITTAEPRVDRGRALVSMAPQTSEVIWESTLKEAPEVTLLASKQSNQFEVWRLNPGTQWHFDLKGIAVTAHQENSSGSVGGSTSGSVGGSTSGSSRWSPTWQPWPGESVKIVVSRPTGVQGQTLTVDGTLVKVEPGARATDTTLSTTLRSSRGGQHVILLPEGAVLQNVDINGQPQPIRLIGREVRLPLVPGTQKVRITWREPTGMSLKFTTPQVNMNAPSVNARIQLLMPTDRWPLFVGGPIVGPAVLIWGVLVVMLIVAYALGRVKFTPLKMWQWALLGIGLTQVSPIASAIFVGWLFMLGLRKTVWPTLGRWAFNLGQLLIAGWTIIALAILVWAVSSGLLGNPDMHIVGNGSYAQLLNWFADRAPLELPTAWVMSVPLWVYRGLMLLWALWLAYALLQWLKWGWSCFTTNGYWRGEDKGVETPQAAAATGSSAAPAVNETPPDTAKLAETPLK